MDLINRRNPFMAIVVLACTILTDVVMADNNTAAAPRGLAGGGSISAPVDADYYENGRPSAVKVQLGQALFFDKVLSGNLNIACATCHHPLTDTGDGLSLPIGEGGSGLGVTRNTGTGAAVVPERVPRNAPHLFNLGAREFKVLFADGRVAQDPSQPSGFLSPAGDELPQGLDNPLAVQAMFPVTSGTEMAGQAGENPVADAAAIGDLAGPDGVWAQLAERLRGIGAYVDLFVLAFDDVSQPGDITFVHAANAIAAFEAVAWRADDSPFDRFLRGDRQALTNKERRGMRVFYSRSRGNCATCHAGTFQTDQGFYSIAMPQIGPGKGDGTSGQEDFGRERVTGDPVDRFRFRVPSLRNVALTAPYGHAGAFDSLEAVVRHHLDTTASLEAYDRREAVLPSRTDLDLSDFIVHGDQQLRGNLAASSDLAPVALSDRELSDLLAFLEALTDSSSIDLRRDVPAELPSGSLLAE